MKDLTSYVKQNNSDVVELESFKKLARTLTGIEKIKGETVSDVVKFISDNYVGGGSSNGSGGPSITEKEYRFKTTDNSEGYFYGYTTKYQGKNIVQIPVMSPNGMLLDITKKDNGRYLLFTHETMLKGVLSCIYYSYNDDYSESEHKKGVIEFDGNSQDVYLITDEEFEKNKSIVVVASGMLLEYLFI